LKSIDISNCKLISPPFSRRQKRRLPIFKEIQDSRSRLSPLFRGNIFCEKVERFLQGKGEEEMEGSIENLGLRIDASSQYHQKTPDDKSGIKTF
jgi:hypothetical protein